MKEGRSEGAHNEGGLWNERQHQKRSAELQVAGNVFWLEIGLRWKQD